MMASQQTKLHDPMYTFDTHFPEKLSRLHLHSELPGSFRKKRSRAERNSARYKTQPVTFDEIKEVDEEPTPSEDKLQPDNLFGQLQAFSRSMDGLIPKTARDHVRHFHPHGSHSRSGSRKFHRHPDCIPEKAEGEQQQQQDSLLDQKNSHQIGVSPMAERLPPLHKSKSEDDNLKQCDTKPNTTPASFLPAPVQEKLPVDVQGAEAMIPPISPAHMASRRQKVTAKAKKRQKATEEGQNS